MIPFTDIIHNGKVRFVAGLVVFLFALISLAGCFSHIFFWKENQSLLEAPAYFGADMQAVGDAGILGSGWGSVLVGTLFGLGAFVFCAALLYVAVRLLFNKKISWMKTALWGIVGTFSISLLLAWLAAFPGGGSLDLVWGGGLGGSCGDFLVKALARLFGKSIALCFILALAVGVAMLSFDSGSGLSLSIPSFRRKESSADDASKKIPAALPAESPSVISLEAPYASEEIPEQPAPQDSVQPAPQIPVQPAFEAPESSAPQAPVQPAACEDTPPAAVNISGPEEELNTDVEEELPQLDIRSDVDRYQFPSLDILEDYADKRYTIPKEEIDRNVEKIKATLASFRIPIDSISASVGYTVTLYKISLGEGGRINSVKNLEDDIAIKIGIKGVRVVKLADAVGIEVPNDRPSVVPLKAILNSETFRAGQKKYELPIALGYTITTKAKVFDLADAPHLLVAGATKQGKSVGLNAIIASLLYAKHPTEMKFVFIDPKMVEFQKYSKILNHYLALLPPLDGADEADSAIVKDTKNAEAVLRSLCVEMDERYKLLSVAGVNKVTDYNEKYRNRHLRPDEGHHFMPYIVIVVDEYADLTKSAFGTDKNLSRSIENSINRLAAKGRAAGLHIIIATQRPSVDVITGTIKGNFPTRMAFRTAQRQDSQTILGMPGAEKLIGKGDMLFFTGADAERVQCALVDSDEIDALTKFIAAQTGYKQKCPQPYYLPDPGELDGSSDGSSSSGGMIDMSHIDPMFEEAARLTVMNMNMSTSMLQRKLQLGFARAGRIMDQLEAAGIVGPQQGSKPRESLVPDLASLQGILDAFLK